jgi:hypothetical protein
VYWNDRSPLLNREKLLKIAVATAAYWWSFEQGLRVTVAFGKSCYWLRGLGMTRFGAAAACGLAATMSSVWAADMPLKAPSPVSVVRDAWAVTFASEVRYYAWEGDRGTPPNLEPPNTSRGSGSQWYVPIALQVIGKPSERVKLTFNIRSGWVHSSQTTSGLIGTVDTWLDTVMSGSITYLGNGVQPFVSMSVNAPTGRSTLFGSSANARMDPDLVEISSFGEGWNVGPTVGVSVPLTESFIVTGSVGYTWRDRFNRERSTAETDPALQTTTSVDPGDVITGTLGVNYRDARWTWSLTGTISEETTTTENGAPLYQAGRRYLATASVARSWPAQWGQTTLTASYAHSNRNKVLLAGVDPLITEIFNNNADVYRVGLQHLFLIGQNLALGPTASYLHRNNNGYNPGTLQFVPAKERWAVGGLARRAVGNNVTLNIRGEHVWTREDERIAPGDQLFSVLLNDFVPGSAVPTLSHTGWMVAGGINVVF